ADERRASLAPDRLRPGALDAVQAAAGRVREAAADAGTFAVRGVAARARLHAAARAAADLRASARRSRAGHRVGARHAAHRLPEAAAAGRLGAFPAALSPAAHSAARRRKAVFLYLPARAHLGRKKLAGAVLKGARRSSLWMSPQAAGLKKISVRGTVETAAQVS